MVAGIGSVVLAGGGTAGHVNPLLAVADELRVRDPQITITALGTAGGLEDDLVPARGYTLRHLPRVPLPRRPSPQWVSLPVRFKAAIDTAGEVLDEVGARVVVGFGGYVSTPAYYAAHRRGIPIVIHEQNARPGIANRVGARWAAQIGVTFEGTQLRGAHLTGLPLRREIAELIRAQSADRVRTRAAAAARLGLDPRMTTVVVTGGSLGALSLNRAVCGAASAILGSGAQVLHLAGKGKDGPVRAAVAGATGRYVVLEYLAAMQDAYAVADLVICRSGAGTVSELAALGIPAVYVPLPIGNGEQRLNARPVVDAGGGLLVDDAGFTSEWVAAQVPVLAGDPQVLAAMARAAASVGVRDGAARVADLVAAAAEAGGQ